MQKCILFRIDGSYFYLEHQQILRRNSPRLYVTVYSYQQKAKRSCFHRRINKNLAQFPMFKLFKWSAYNRNYEYNNKQRTVIQYAELADQALTMAPKPTGNSQLQKFNAGLMVGDSWMCIRVLQYHSNKENKGKHRVPAREMNIEL